MIQQWKCEFLNQMALDVLEVCKSRDWSLSWHARGAYLHLEASELIEAVRGKRGDPKDEAGDVLIVLMSITESNGIKFTDVVESAMNKLANLQVSPQYPGESRGES